jgi:HD superfamily phosphohydrolase YqeK
MMDRVFEGEKGVLTMEYYAHSVEGKPTSEWHGLYDHLLSVANLAKQFAEVFNSGEWAYVAGLWHPLRSNQLSKGGK